MSESVLPSKLRPLRETLTLSVLAGSLLFAVAATVLGLWLPRMLGSIVDDLVAGEMPIRVLIKEAGMYFGLALVAAVFSKWMRQVPMRWAPRISHHVRVRLHRHLLSLDENQIHDQRVGELMSRLQSDVNAVAEMLAQGGHSLVRAMLTLGIAFTFMFQRSSALALVLSLLLPFLVVIGFVMMRSIRFRHLGVQEQLGVLTTYCQESFGGLRILRGLGLESLRLDRFRDLNQEFIHRNLALSRIEILAWPVIHVGFVIGNVLLLWVGGRQVIRGEIPLGMLVEFQQYLMILQWPSLSVAWTLSLILRGRASLGRLQEIMDATPQVVDDDKVENELPEGIGEIRLEHVSLQLEGRRVLHDISFTVQPGGMLGITGPTGSGKTLLLQLLLRRKNPESGRILINGRDVREVSLETLYRNCRIAPQEPVLFSMTLEENLLLADPDVSDDELQRALYLSALDQDLPQLPLGLQTRIGEKGVTLSGGQRQRCAIARALIANPSVLLMDDSLSAVDTSTEALILERLLPEVRGRTLLMVSHRYAALRHCDQVLVLREGRIVESGTPEELLELGGDFADLAKRQRLQAQLEVDDD